LRSLRPLAASVALAAWLPCAASGVQRTEATTQEEVREPVVERRGDVFLLRYHGVEESAAVDAQAEQALSTIERTWPRVCQLLGAPATKPAAPLAVNLYRTIAGYAAADRRLTGGKFERNLAMTEHAGGTAHVALQPPCSDETLRAVGLPGATLSLLAWEAVHAARHHLCPNHAFHPMWVVDGLASFVAREAACAELDVDAASFPLFATHAAVARDLATARKLPPLKDLLGDRIDDLAMHDRYAARAVAFAFLAADSRGPKLEALLKQARQFGGGDGLTSELERLAAKSFGDLTKTFERHVAAAEPDWQETYRSLSPRGKEWLQIAFPDCNALAWRSESIKGGIAASGAVRILPADGRQLNFLFGRTGDDFFSLALVADVGWTLFDYHARENRWERFGSQSFPALRLGYTSTFKLDAAGTTLKLKLDQQEWSVTLPRPFPAESRWGLGAQASSQGQSTGSAGIWSALDIKSQPPRKP
jgi:hypothetical protein